MNGPSAGGHAEAVIATDAWGAPGIRVTHNQVIPAALVPPPRHDDRGKRRPPGMQKNGPGGGAIFGSTSLVVPMTVTLDDHRAVAVAVPAAMPAAVMFVEPGARTAKLVTVAIVVAVAADAETKTLGARHCRRCNRDGS